MNVRPTSNPASTPVDAGAVRRATPGTTRTGSSDPAIDARRDAVELSPEALALQARPEGDAASSIAPERLRSVAERIASGFYDQPEVQDRTLERLGPDLESA